MSPWAVWCPLRPIHRSLLEMTDQGGPSSDAAHGALINVRDYSKWRGRGGDPESELLADSSEFAVCLAMNPAAHLCSHVPRLLSRL